MRGKNGEPGKRDETAQASDYGPPIQRKEEWGNAGYHNQRSRNAQPAKAVGPELQLLPLDP